MKRFSLIAWALFLFACKGSGSKLVVGSKPFTESEIVGEMIALLAEDLGAAVERRFHIGGMICFKALRTGDMDVYVEYTGTGLVNILNEPAMTDPDKVYERVRAQFRKRWGLSWGEPLGFNNTYTLMMRRVDAEKRGLTRMSQLSGLAKKLNCGFDLVFYDRPDGYRGMVSKYGEFCDSTKQMDPGLMYTALAKGNVDVISGYSTDGRIKSLDLMTLIDDKHFFPPYYAAPLTAPSAFKKLPGLRAKLAALAGKLTDREMTRLNAEVDANGLPARQVAREFLKAKGLLELP